MEELLSKFFEVKKLDYSDDIIIRNKDSNLWTRIRFKFLYEKKQFYCTINQEYKNYIVFLISDTSKWIIPVPNIISNNIKIIESTNSSYYIYKINNEEIYKTICKYIKDFPELLQEIKVASRYFDYTKIVKNKKIRYTYEDIKIFIEEKQSKLITSKEDYKTTKSKIKIVLKCGHELDTIYTEFMRKCTNECKKCIDKLMKTKNFDANTGIITNIKNECDIIYKLFDILKPFFTVKKHKKRV